MALLATGFVACSGDDVTTELDGMKDKFLVLEKGSYNYDAHIGEYGGYSIRIELLW
ncbi:hypothetical protein [Avrilella dinanensis]|uniref:hypothetical protein n=1 Tax=Avrilella dinanensis TaxID=2008672 RepID=UPI00240A1433|nr:hypothetical protein [Avrilella dinanensis]